MKRIARQRSARFIRRSFFVDEGAIRRARRVLGVHENAEAVRLAVERVVEMEEFWRFMTRSRASLKPETIELPRSHVGRHRYECATTLGARTLR
jgi:hypothetical protein